MPAPLSPPRRRQHDLHMPAPTVWPHLDHPHQPQACTLPPLFLYNVGQATEDEMSNTRQQRQEKVWASIDANPGCGGFPCQKELLLKGEQADSNPDICRHCDTAAKRSPSPAIAQAKETA